jgi:hypothetical protein
MEVKIEVENIKEFIESLEIFMNENKIKEGELKIEGKTIMSFKATMVKEYSTEEIIKMNSKIFLNEASIKKIKMYFSGWEGDTESWILEDGRIFTTDHERICEFTPENFKIYKKEMIEYAESLENV